MTETDLMIIGGGPGGYETALYAAQKGLKVVIAEARELGGTCLNRGCIPTKALLHDSEAATAIAANPDNHDAFEDALRRAMARKDAVVQGLRKGVETLLGNPAITLLQGHAEFVDPHTVQVGDETVTAKDIIVATGSKTKLPPVPGIQEDGKSRHVVTSDDLLSMTTLPGTLCIVGAGVIGLEMATVFQRFGCKVDVVEFMKECLPQMDGEIAKRLRKSMEKQGITFHLSCAVQRVEDDKVVFLNTKKNREESLQADCILVATGRAPMVDGLKAEAAGLEVGRHGIAVDENMQTSVAHIYAVGDVSGRQMLAHAASFEGRRAVNHILGLSDNIRLDVMPAAVFTQPEVAGVGLTDEQAKEQGRACSVHKAIYRANGRAQAVEATEGLVKLICDDSQQPGRIVGCHVIGSEAAAIVQEVAALMNFDITLDRLSDIVHIHPTLAETLLAAARN